MNGDACSEISYVLEETASDRPNLASANLPVRRYCAGRSEAAGPASEANYRNHGGSGFGYARAAGRVAAFSGGSAAEGNDIGCRVAAGFSACGLLGVSRGAGRGR